MTDLDQIPTVPELSVLVDARKNLGVTQAEVAERIDKSASTISSWENGRSAPKLYDARQYAGALYDAAQEGSDDS